MTSIIEITPMNAEYRFLNNFQGGLFSRPVFANIFQYLQVNTTGMENTHICQHFANLGWKASGQHGDLELLFKVVPF